CQLGFIGYSVSVLITFIIWEGCRGILFFFRKQFPNIEQTIQRLAITFVAVVFYTFLISISIHAVFEWILPSDEQIGAFFKFGINFIATGIVIIIYESAFFFQQWKQTIVEKENLKLQHVKSQFSALKNQITPHFLFNSLNTLVTLIAENQNAAIDFTQKLSEVYRYILQHKDKEVISLEKELQFVESYIFLLKTRFSENLKVEISIPKERMQYFIAPLSLQMLVENAIKHNEVSTARPLYLTISVENDNLVVKNNLQRKSSVAHSTKTGLENIKQRYKHLSHHLVEVIVTTSSFIVAIPLLDVRNEEAVLL
ncbi:MAG: two-component system LytT family sensor kinase, partial [Arenicella sp.]